MQAQIAEFLSTKVSGKFWSKNGKNRFYLSDVYNTSKCKQSAYIDLDTFVVSCYTDCPNQSYEWCKSQNNEIISYNQKFARFSRMIAYKLSVQ